MSKDQFYEKCCLKAQNCQGKIEWHHAIIYAGRQLQKKFAIVPLCKDFHHRYADQYDIKKKIMKIVLNRAKDSELIEISKAINYLEMKRKLNE